MLNLAPEASGALIENSTPAYSTPSIPSSLLLTPPKITHWSYFTLILQGGSFKPWNSRPQVERLSLCHAHASDRSLNAKNKIYKLGP
jgi:hypothetical protein